MSIMINAAENGRIPDFLIRVGIKQLIKQRKNEIHSNMNFYKNEMLNKLKDAPIAIHTDKANEQHYEVPSAFYQMSLGKNLKYSCSLFEDTEELDEAETKMLELYCQRAELKDGLDILELGCGWGSLTLFLAKKYPNSKITAISNSKTQREYILKQASFLGLRNINIITTDINLFSTSHQYDRIISIEMFEHIRNYDVIFNSMKNWLKDDGRVFIHIFCHKEATYFFETEGDDNWMGKFFFTGGTMPSFDLFENIQSSLKLKCKWQVNGTHYQKTSEAWLENTKKNKAEIIKTFESTYGKEEAEKWFYRWKIFFASCAELFGHDNGEEWFVGHYLFEK